MKFVKLHSRGGNYLVVASNIAWLRSAENGQTSVGMVGGQPLLVVGSIEEVAEQILNAAAEQDAPVAGSAPAPVAPPPSPVEVAAPVEVVAPVEQPVAPAPEPVAPPLPPAPESEPDPVAIEPEPEPEPVAVVPEAEPEPEPELAPTPTPSARTASPAAARPRPVPRGSASLWERPVAAPAQGLKVKAGSQRMMGALD